MRSRITEVGAEVINIGWSKLSDNTKLKLVELMLSNHHVQFDPEEEFRGAELEISFKHHVIETLPRLSGNPDNWCPGDIEDEFEIEESSLYTKSIDIHIDEDLAWSIINEMGVQLEALC
jgi:hypothetical protein